jgi:YD repeat-containing protein
VTPGNGFTGTVSFSVTAGLPAGTTATFTPISVTGGSGTNVLTITTSLTTPAGTSMLTISGTSGTLVHTTTVTLIVTTAAITYAYDDLGRLSSVVDPTGATAVYTYDALGNLLSIIRQTPIGISSFSPTTGLVGTTVTIVGTGFSSLASQDTVKFNGVTATITSATPTQIVATVPSSATRKRIHRS